MKRKLLQKRLGLIMLLPWLLGGSMMAQSLITGVVKDAGGELLPGVSGYVENTTNGTITGIDGTYQISASKDESLVFSFIGFQTQVIAVGTQQTINVTLVEELKRLDEVVVTGYTTQSRAEMTTSIAKLDTKVLESAPRSNAATALQGTIAGLQVTQTTGQPGSTPSLVLRGGTSFDGKGTPLILSLIHI
jgi:hypothetical protein